MKSNTYPSKYASPKEIFMVGKTRFKWYDLATDPSEISSEDVMNAKMCIENADEHFQNIADLGFVIMHRCGENYLLLWSVPGAMKTNYGKAFTTTAPENLKSGTEISFIFLLTASGKWVSYIMNPGHGKNIWDLPGNKMIKRTI